MCLTTVEARFDPPGRAIALKVIECWPGEAEALSPITGLELPWNEWVRARNTKMIISGLTVAYQNGFHAFELPVDVRLLENIRIYTGRVMCPALRLVALRGVYTRGQQLTYSVSDDFRHRKSIPTLVAQEQMLLDVPVFGATHATCVEDVERAFKQALEVADQQDVWCRGTQLQDDGRGAIRLMEPGRDMQKYAEGPQGYRPENRPTAANPLVTRV